MILTMASSSNVPENSREEGELSQGDSPQKTPLARLHKKKLTALNADQIQDSLKRSRKRPKVQDSESDSDDLSTRGLENSIIEGLKKSKSSEISLRQSGLLESKTFMLRFG